MASFEFSFITNEIIPTTLTHLNRLVDVYNDRHPHHTAQLIHTSWGSAWQQLMRVAIYKKGPVLSEIGAPWTNDFVGMNSLRPFDPAEIQRMGGESIFAAEAWKNCQSSESGQVWGIPSRVDARVFYYWKDMFDKAAIDPQTAFQTPQSFYETLARLQAAGFERPLAWTSDGSRNSVYNSASWIWAHGGDVIDASGKLAFHQPPAQQGLIEYFSVHPFVADPTEGVTPHFARRKCAVTLNHMAPLHEFRNGYYGPWSQDLDDRLGTALLPGPAFVGGTNLVIWQHSSHNQVQAALELLTQLITSPDYPKICLDSGYLPANQAALDALQKDDDPRLRTLVQALQTGRANSSAHLWVLVAERLGGALGSIWTSLRQNPSQDVGELVRRITQAAATRLEQTLA